MADNEMFVFQAVTTQLLGSTIHSSISNKETFLKELIRSSSISLDKIKADSLTDKSKLDSQPELFIHIIPDRTKNTLTLVDTGTGMTKSDLVNSIKDLAAGVDVSVTGQFGVGVYFASLVADKVIVTTKHNDDQQYSLEFQVEGGYPTVTRDSSGGKDNKNQGQGKNRHPLQNLAYMETLPLMLPVNLEPPPTRPAAAMSTSATTSASAAVSTISAGTALSTSSGEACTPSSNAAAAMPDQNQPPPPQPAAAMSTSATTSASAAVSTISVGTALSTSSGEACTPSSDAAGDSKVPLKERPSWEQFVFLAAQLRSLHNEHEAAEQEAAEALKFSEFEEARNKVRHMKEVEDTMDSLLDDLCKAYVNCGNDSVKVRTHHEENIAAAETAIENHKSEAKTMSEHAVASVTSAEEQYLEDMTRCNQEEDKIACSIWKSQVKALFYDAAKREQITEIERLSDGALDRKQELSQQLQREQKEYADMLQALNKQGVRIALTRTLIKQADEEYLHYENVQNALADQIDQFHRDQGLLDKSYEKIKQDKKAAEVDAALLISAAVAYNEKADQETKIAEEISGQVAFWKSVIVNLLDFEEISSKLRVIFQKKRNLKKMVRAFKAQKSAIDMFSVEGVEAAFKELDRLATETGILQPEDAEAVLVMIGEVEEEIEEAIGRLGMWAKQAHDLCSRS